MLRYMYTDCTYLRVVTAHSESRMRVKFASKSDRETKPLLLSVNSPVKKLFRFSLIKSSRVDLLLHNNSSILKVIASHKKYAILPKKVIIGKRLAQCLHPALPAGVHLKALELYETIFTTVDKDVLVRDFPIYRYDPKI